MTAIAMYSFLKTDIAPKFLEQKFGILSKPGIRILPESYEKFRGHFALFASRIQPLGKLTK
jgi:hypothetical protein